MSVRLFLGREDVDEEERLLRLEVEADREGKLSRELDARLEPRENQAGRGEVRGGRDFLRGVEGPGDV